MHAPHWPIYLYPFAVGDGGWPEANARDRPALDVQSQSGKSRTAAFVAAAAAQQERKETRPSPLRSPKSIMLELEQHTPLFTAFIHTPPLSLSSLVNHTIPISIPACMSQPFRSHPSSAHGVNGGARAGFIPRRVRRRSWWQVPHVALPGDGVPGHHIVHTGSSV